LFSSSGNPKFKIGVCIGGFPLPSNNRRDWRRSPLIHFAFDPATHVRSPFLNERALLSQITFAAHRAVAGHKSFFAQRPQRIERFQPLLRVAFLYPGLHLAENVITGKEHAFFFDDDGSLKRRVARHVDHAEAVIAGV
jgi:hypothetical protein